MSSRRDRLALLGGLALVWSGSCAVFPDHAVLPDATTLAGAGGEASSNAAAGTSDIGAGGRGGAVGSGGSAGASIGASAGTPLGGAWGDGGAVGDGGAAGDGGNPQPACENPVDEVAIVSLDTWIEHASQDSGHGDDTVLSVVGGGSPRRALFELTLPVMPEGAVLLEASLELHLEKNAHAMLAERTLAVHRLLHPISESKTTWRQFANGAKGDWDAPGGDFAAERGDGVVPASSMTGLVPIDARPAVAPVFASQVDVSLIVLETSAPPPAPADLSFTSSEGATSDAPKLRLRYCPP